MWQAAQHYYSRVELMSLAHLLQLDPLWTITANNKCHRSASSTNVWYHIHQQVDTLTVHQPAYNDYCRIIAVKLLWVGNEAMCIDGVRNHKHFGLQETSAENRILFTVRRTYWISISYFCCKILKPTSFCINSYADDA